MEAVIQDCRLFYRYEKAAREDAPTLLLLHGWGCDGSIFAVFEKEWSQHASLLVVDFPGHGNSGEPPVAWGVPEYAEQLAKLMANLSVKECSIVAHSFGGRVALYLAAYHPEWVKKIVLTGGAGLRAPAAPALSKKQKQYKRLKGIVNFFVKIPFLKPLAEKAMNALRQRYGSEDYKRLKTDVMRNTFVKVINQDLSDLLPKIQASTLLIWGSQDTATPLWMGQKMEKEIPDAGLIVFEGRTHFAFVEEWQRFQTIVNTFFWGGNAA